VTSYAVLRNDHAQQILRQKQQVVRITRARLEVKMLVKSLGVIVLGVNEQRPGANGIRSLRRAE
jgi:hypothetical protein